MKWWFWLVLELLIIFGVMAWIFLVPCELIEEDLSKALLAYVLVFCIEKTRQYFKEKQKMFTVQEVSVFGLIVCLISFVLGALIVWKFKEKQE